MNVLKPILSEVLLGIAISIVLCGLWLLMLGNDVLTSLGQGTLLFLGGMCVGLVVWIVLLILFRRRAKDRAATSPGSRIGWSILAAVIAGAVNLIVLSIVGLVAGGWDAFLVLFAFIATGAFAIGALIANLLTHLAIAKAPSVEPAETRYGIR